MDKLNIGGGNVLDLDSTASLLRRQDISFKLQQLRESWSASKRILAGTSDGEPVVLTLTSSTVPKGTPRMLTQAELDELRQTLTTAAERTSFLLDTDFSTYSPK